MVLKGAYGLATRGSSSTYEKLLLAVAFHGAVVPILDTHSLNVATRARCRLGSFGAADATFLRVGALVGRFRANWETRRTLPV